MRKSASAAAGSGSPTKRVTTGAAAGSMSHSDESATAKILKGLAGVASKRDEQAERHARIRGVELDPTADDMDDQLKRFEQEEKKQKNKLWGAGMGAKIDYSDLFDPDVGEVLGTTTWRIENFLPVLVDEVEYGKFYEADCYIILHTALDRAQNLDWNIYFWIGSKSTLDKKASAAMNAVNLRNHIGASKQTQREEQGAESRRFMKVFNRSVSYIQGWGGERGGRGGRGMMWCENSAQYSTQRRYGERLLRDHQGGGADAIVLAARQARARGLGRQLPPVVAPSRPLLHARVCQENLLLARPQRRL